MISLLDLLAQEEVSNAFYQEDVLRSIEEFCDPNDSVECKDQIPINLSYKIDQNLYDSLSKVLKFQDGVSSCDISLKTLLTKHTNQGQQLVQELIADNGKAAQFIYDKWGDLKKIVQNYDEAKNSQDQNIILLKGYTDDQLSELADLLDKDNGILFNLLYGQDGWLANFLKLNSDPASSLVKNHSVLNYLINSFINWSALKKPTPIITYNQGEDGKYSLVYGLLSHTDTDQSFKGVGDVLSNENAINLIDQIVQGRGDFANLILDPDGNLSQFTNLVLKDSNLASFLGYVVKKDPSLMSSIADLYSKELIEDKNFNDFSYMLGKLKALGIQQSPMPNKFDVEDDYSILGVINYILNSLPFLDSKSTDDSDSDSNYVTSLLVPWIAAKIGNTSNE